LPRALLFAFLSPAIGTLAAAFLLIVLLSAGSAATASALPEPLGQLRKPPVNCPLQRRTTVNVLSVYRRPSIDQQLGHRTIIIEHSEMEWCSSERVGSIHVRLMGNE